MMGPISTLGRAAEASVQQKQSSGMPPDQAVAYTEQLLLDGISPDLETMMAQASQLRQMQRKPPQMTIRDQLNQAYQGIAGLPTPGFQPGFNEGGIVAFASGDLVDDMMPRLTPEQIRMQMMRQKAAEGRMGLGSYGIGLENYPELIEDVPEGKRVVTNIVDDKGNLWHKLEDGTFRQASGKRLEGAKIEGGRLVYPDRPSIVQREATAYRAGQPSGIRGLPGPDVTVDRTSGRDVVTDRRPTTATPDVKKPGRISRGLAALGPVAVAGGVGAMISDVGERAEAQRGEGADTGPVFPIGAMGVAYSTKSAPKPSDIGDMFSSFFSGATLGIFGDREAERAAERKPEAKPEAKPAAKPKPSGGGAAVPAKARQGMFDIPIAIETARATLNYAVKEDDEFQKLLKRAEAEGTGPYSKMFTEGDRIKTERMEALKKSKDSNFGRALVAAGLAMAQQAAKGGQPGNESQKFLAAAVEGLGGYMKAQEFLGQEREKAQKELDKFTLDMEQLREASRGDLRGLALKRFNDAQARAEKANDNARGLMIVQAQLETSMDLAQTKAASSLQNAQIRAQSQLMAQAQKEIANSPGYMAAEMKYAQATQAKNPKEQQAALAEMEDLIQKRVRMNMQIPSYMAGIQYNPASGDLDFSATDAIVEMALGTGK